MDRCYLNIKVTRDIFWQVNENRGRKREGTMTRLWRVAYALIENDLGSGA